MPRLESVAVTREVSDEYLKVTWTGPDSNSEKPCVNGT